MHLEFSMSRPRRRGFTEPVMVNTPASDGGGLRTPCSASVFETSEVKAARPALDVSNFSSNGAELQIGLELSDDGETWPGSTSQPSFLFSTANTLAKKDTEGVYYAINGSFEDVSSAMTKKYGRWVFWYKNKSGTSTAQLCLAAVRIETKSC